MEATPTPDPTPSAVTSYHCMGNATMGVAANLTAEDHFLQTTRFCIQRILVPIVVAVGVVGNSATIVVLTRRRMRSSTNVYLTALAVSDLLYLVAVFFLSLEHYPGSARIEYIAYWHARPFCLWLADSMSGMSIWLTVTFTVERYVAVCHPMRGRLLCTEQRAKKAVLIIALLSLLTTSTVPWEYQVLIADEYGERCARTDSSDLGANKLYIKLFYWFNAVVFTLTPLILLAIFNCFLVSAVHRSHRQRCTMTQSVSAHQKQENRITVTLIAVVILFMVCQTPAAVTLVYSSFQPEISKIQRGLGNIFNFLMAINAAANFLLYCVLSDKYRRTFVLTFFPRCLPAPATNARRSASMYSTHTDFTRTGTRSRSNRVTNSVYLSVPINRNGRTSTDSKGGGDDGGSCDGDEIICPGGEPNGKGQNQII